MNCHFSPNRRDRGRVESGQHLDPGRQSHTDGVDDQLVQSSTPAYELANSRWTSASLNSSGVDRLTVVDEHGLAFTPAGAIEDAPQLDVLHIPGGPGQEALMEDTRVLGWITDQAAQAQLVFSVCTGALLLGAAGMLRDGRATTHWASMELLPYFGAHPVDRRVVRDGRIIFAAGVTAGIDGALTAAADLRGSDEAQGIQLALQYAPEPPFSAGTPQTAPAPVLQKARERGSGLLERRRKTASEAASRLGVVYP